MLRTCTNAIYYRCECCLTSCSLQTITFRSFSISYRTAGNLFHTRRLKAGTCQRLFVSELQSELQCRLAKTELQNTLNISAKFTPSLAWESMLQDKKYLKPKPRNIYLFLVNGEVPEKVDRFCYLGGTVTEKPDMEVEIQRRIQSATKAIYRMKPVSNNHESGAPPKRRFTKQ